MIADVKPMQITASAIHQPIGFIRCIKTAAASMVNAAAVVSSIAGAPSR